MKAFASAAKTSSKEKMMSEQRLNGCHNRPRPTAETKLVVQDVYFHGMYHNTVKGHSDRIPHTIEIKYAMTTECQYTKTTYDPACQGCAHRVMNEKA